MTQQSPSSGRVAVVTGASRGIGRAVALALAQAGADVVLGYVSRESEAAEVAGQVEGLGRRARLVRGDVAQPATAEALVKAAVDGFGRIDILVNNAGITRDTLLMRMSEQDWDDVLTTNLKSAFLCTKAAIRPMLRQRSGRIVNISSVVGSTGNAGQANYAAAKAGLIALTKSTAREVGSRGITVNAVAPGVIETEMTAGLSDELKQQYRGQIPLDRFGRTEEVAAVVAFLTSELAGYITGQVIHVNGGLAMP